MYDIICVDGVDPTFYNFHKFYLFSEIKNKIKHFENITDVSNLRKQKILVTLSEYPKDSKLLKLISSEKKICFLIDLGRLIKSSGFSRSVSIFRLRNFLSLCNKCGAFYAFASFSIEEKIRPRQKG